MLAPVHLSSRTRTVVAILVVASLLLAICSFRDLIQLSWALVSLFLTWSRGAADFLISREQDGFDVTFANYSQTQTSALPLHQDRVPPVLHHILLGGGPMKPAWRDAMKGCLDWHPGWESHMWTDDNARDFVAERFPEMLATWDGYRYPVQRVDALRYMALYEFGGVILDIDLKCKRSLGPLRRFDFVAPAAHPTGFSIGFMMAAKRNEFVRRVINSLKPYDRQWLGLPYPTVMFSTGCHFASTMHSLEANRTSLKILAGPKSNPNLHKLNGHVSTPLFDHLGSSSWHSYDASLIVKFGKAIKSSDSIFFFLGLFVVLWIGWRRIVRKRRAFAYRPLRLGKMVMNEGDDRV